MALVSIGSNLIGSGIQVNLGTTDNAYVASGVLVSSSNDSTIYGSGTGRVVYADGAIASANYAILLGIDKAVDHDHKVFIGETGSIKSFSSLSGYASIWMYGYSSVVENRGSIWSLDHGVYVNGVAAGTTSTIMNSGTIEASGRAIWHGTSSEEALVITNSGVITGREYSIYSSGNDATSIEKITNTGKIVGDMFLAAGNDVFDTRSGSYTGVVDAGAGNDTLYGSTKADTFNGGADNDKIYAYAGNDILNGGDGNDYISGGDGNDKITGGLGKDELRGGAGADTFIFLAAAESTVASASQDIIRDFSQSQKDKIDLKAIDAKISTAADNSFTFIGTASYSQKEGELRYKVSGGDTLIYGDTNGDGTSDFKIVLDGIYTLKATDFIL